MKKNYIVFAFILFITFTLNAQEKPHPDSLKLIVDGNNNNNVKVDSVFEKSGVFKGDYFSNHTPENEAILFAEGLIKPKIHHIHSAPVFSPDYKEIYFSVFLDYEDPQCIFSSKKVNGIWQTPELVKFSGQYQDGRPILSPDGETLYFYSKRPKNRGEAISKNSMIWFVKRKNGIWGEPQLLLFNPSLGIAFYPDHYASNGIFYFSIKIVSGDYDLYQCEIKNDKAVNIQRLDEPISMKTIVDLGTVTNSENDILIFQSNNRNNKNGAILYACKKQENGEWGHPEPLSNKINQNSSRFASFSRDGKYFFFASSKSGVEEIYWIKSSQILGR